jgi:hypothetical protein
MKKKSEFGGYEQEVSCKQQHHTHERVNLEVVTPGGGNGPYI